MNGVRQYEPPGGKYIAQACHVLYIYYSSEWYGRILVYLLTVSPGTLY